MLHILVINSYTKKLVDNIRVINYKISDYGSYR